MKQKNTDLESRVFTRQRKASMKTCSSLYKLDPFLDVNGIFSLLVGGRLRQATLGDHNNCRAAITAKAGFDAKDDGQKDNYGESLSLQ